jgi:galacturonosyltransferase
MIQKKVLIINNSITSLIYFRKELIKELIKQNYDVYFAVPEEKNDKQVQELIEIGAKHIQKFIERRSTNPLNELKLIREYRRIFKQIEPDIILSFTIKPNIYGTYIASKRKIPIIINITGLGSAFNNSKIKFIAKNMYKYASKRSNFIFFQNQENYNYFIDNKLTNKEKSKIIPGSGVNLEKFAPQEKSNENNIIRFLFIGRIMKEKGIEEYLEAAKNIKNKYPNTEFQIVGPYEEELYKEILNNSTYIKYLGKSEDVRKEIKEVDCIINPSYHEGMSNVLLEGAAMEKFLIASDVPGCREIVEENYNGYTFEVKDSKDLENKIEKFIKLSEKEKQKMSKNSRKKVEKEFDRNIIIEEYLKKIKELI